MEVFAEILKLGGKTNSLGRAQEVIYIILDNKSRLDELFDCLFNEDAWVRMRAADSVEKICRVHPDWIEPYIDRMLNELTSSRQPSILWHLAQIFTQVNLNQIQEKAVVTWLEELLASYEIDWIVSANAMAALAHFSRKGSIPKSTFIRLIKVQTNHKSKAVVKRAKKLLDESK